MDETTKKKIQELLASKKIFLFMKGTPEEPRCGYSARVVDILKQQNVEYGSFDVLSDQTIWDGIREFGNWPTIPQVYVAGKLVGGCDIVMELADSGELTKVLTAEA